VLGLQSCFYPWRVKTDNWQRGIAVVVCTQRGLEECTRVAVQSTSARYEADDDDAERSGDLDAFSTGQSLWSAPAAAAIITLLLLLTDAASLRDNTHCCFTRLLTYDVTRRRVFACRRSTDANIRLYALSSV